jgi:RING-like zinc finger
MQQLIPTRFKTALYQLVNATNPASALDAPMCEKGVDCCICLSAIGPFQALFISPCSHSFHYKCIKGCLGPNMFPCPVCRQVANLEASVSMESLVDYAAEDDMPETEEVGDDDMDCEDLNNCTLGNVTLTPRACRVWACW